MTNTADTHRTKAARRRALVQTLTGLAFLSPNILGFLAFTLGPLLFSLVLAFTNWDIRFHNMFQNQALQFAGVENFARLFREPDFLRFLGNTLFFMVSIPLSMAGSLGAAILLSRDTRGGSRKIWLSVVATGGLTAGILLLLAAGARGAAMSMLFAGVFGLFLVGGALGGVSVYRTLFFLPNFTSGVAVYLLWKKMYSDIGPINTALAKPLASLGSHVVSLGPNPFRVVLFGAFLVGMGIVVSAYARRLVRAWCDGEAGTAALAIPVLLLSVPCVVLARLNAADFLPASAWLRWVPLAGLMGTLLVAGARAARCGSDFPCHRWKGSGSEIFIAFTGLVTLFLLLGLALVCNALPALSCDAEGLQPPQWLADYNWAKPAIMIMGLWSSIGSNNMLLYIAGLSSVPPELYEAADIDGATPMQRFWHVTWPQLAPVTFFIFIMSIIGGLQGGFETAKAMTDGGPAGATTTLSYFIYSQGFETGRFGSASGVAWALFAMVLVVTLINWKFGSRYVND